MLPPYSLDDNMTAKIAAAGTAIARELGVVGLMNMQVAVTGTSMYIIEVNPRASRTVPFRKQSYRSTPGQDRCQSDGRRHLG